MTLELVIFYFLYALLALCGLGVVLSANPVHSILFLVAVFLNAAGLLIISGAEFLGLVLVVVYVGAVAVLFLFVCMMLDIRMESLGWRAVSHLPVGSFIVGFLASLILPILYGAVSEGGGFVYPAAASYTNWVNALTAAQNAVAIGSVLYSVYAHYFILAAVILLVAMVGSIVLTLWRRLDSRKQNIFFQVTRDVIRARTFVG